MPLHEEIGTSLRGTIIGEGGHYATLAPVKLFLFLRQRRSS